MKGDPIISRALNLLRRRKYTDAIRLLEGEAVRYHDSFRYHYILAAACLRAEDFGGAFTYFISARKLKKRDPQVLLGLAALFLRRGDTVQAVEIYLEVQEIERENRTARRALDLIRRSAGPEEMSAWIESGKLKKLFPPLPKAPFAAVRTLLISLGVVLILGALGGILFLTGVLAPGPRREGYEESRLEREEREAPVEIDGSYRYLLTRDQAVAAYEKAQRLFGRYRDEEAKVELNRIIESNASEALRNRARMLLSFTQPPDFGSLKDSFDYPTVMREPILYRDCHVIWEGMAANLVTDDSGTVFNLLVGYGDRTVLQGIVPVQFDFAVNINTSRPLKVLGRIVPRSSPAGMDLELRGLAVQQQELLIPSR
ncbi:MAG: tetratricopeptide repeat protein [Spirochaetaceae bacterium]|jgi:tetratricopeptide (TPR) repeat protein|nr:tetratricopeptide repeat protein [Spirochaetaceae bacterium]